MDIIKGMVIASKARVAIVVSRFNNFINDSLLNGAIDTLERIGQVSNDNITVVWVPGAYELPLTVKILAATKKYNAIIALGTVIRGCTSHFKFIASECSAGLSHIGINSEVPITFGVLITENIEQAFERAGTKAGNKGSEAALTALEMINIIKAIKG
ncbi:6,7-dimethyl-8-ribityllumazine synthase [Candidatus Hartigia pinicola]|nr:6,7-dimethyl-8-ribityllumazine synthase [Candidatus Hartigia pinicola]